MECGKVYNTVGLLRESEVKDKEIFSGQSQPRTGIPIGTRGYSLVKGHAASPRKSLKRAVAAQWPRCTQATGDHAGFCTQRWASQNTAAGRSARDSRSSPQRAHAPPGKCPEEEKKGGKLAGNGIAAEEAVNAKEAPSSLRLILAPTHGGHAKQSSRAIPTREACMQAASVIRGVRRVSRALLCRGRAWPGLALGLHCSVAPRDVKPCISRYSTARPLVDI